VKACDSGCMRWRVHREAVRGYTRRLDEEASREAVREAG